MPVNRAIRSRAIYPVALWLNGSEVVRAFWGFTKNHALHRAERWGNKHHPLTTKETRVRLMLLRLWVSLIRPFHMGNAERWSDRVDRAYGVRATRTEVAG